MSVYQRVMKLIDDRNRKFCDALRRETFSNDSDSGFATSESSGASDSSSNPSSRRSDTPDSNYDPQQRTQSTPPQDSKNNDVLSNSPAFDFLDVAIEILEEKPCDDCSHHRGGFSVRSEDKVIAEELVEAVDDKKEEKVSSGVSNDSKLPTVHDAFIETVPCKDVTENAQEQWEMVQIVESEGSKDLIDGIEITIDQQPKTDSTSPMNLSGSNEIQNTETEKIGEIFEKSSLNKIRGALVEDEWNSMDASVFHYLQKLSVLYHEKSGVSVEEVSNVPAELFYKLLEYSLEWHHHRENGLTAPPPSCEYMVDIPESVLEFFYALIYLRYAEPRDTSEKFEVPVPSQ